VVEFEVDDAAGGDKIGGGAIHGRTEKEEPRARERSTREGDSQRGRAVAAGESREPAAAEDSAGVGREDDAIWEFFFRMLDVVLTIEQCELALLG
jgi:hypothetical protein